jgi:hypothetical protein
MMQAVDDDDSGAIDFAEFVLFMTNLHGIKLRSAIKKVVNVVSLQKLLPQKNADSIPPEFEKPSESTTNKVAGPPFLRVEPVEMITDGATAASPQNLNKGGDAGAVAHPFPAMEMERVEMISGDSNVGAATPIKPSTKKHAATPIKTTDKTSDDVVHYERPKSPVLIPLDAKVPPIEPLDGKVGIKLQPLGSNNKIVPSG